MSNRISSARGSIGEELDPVQPDEAYVHSMSVTAAWQGRGVAAVLLDGLEQAALALHKRWMVVEIEETNLAARRLYARAGYTERQRRRGSLAWLRWAASSRLVLEHRLETERARAVGQPEASFGQPERLLDKAKP